MKENLKSRKGITLIALIITVILMLILASVALSAIGDGGLLEKTQNAADVYKGKSNEEKSLLESLINSVEKYAAEKVSESGIKLSYKKTSSLEDGVVIDLKTEIDEELVVYYDSYEDYAMEILEGLTPTEKENIYVEASNFYVGTNFTNIKNVLKWEYEQGWHDDIYESLEEVRIAYDEHSSVDEMLIDWKCVKPQGYDFDNDCTVPYLYVNDVLQSEYGNDTLESYLYFPEKNGDYTFEVILGEESASVKVPVAELTVAIQYIEDLVDLSIASTNSYGWRNMQFNLLNDLDFDEDNSYRNPTSTEYGDLNENGTVEALKVELTTGIGFTPIKGFTGIFNGCGHEIKNVYMNINTTEYGVALFSKNSGVIANLGVIADFTYNPSSDSSNWYLGGLVGDNDNGTVINCHTSGNLKSEYKPSSYEYLYVGGIVGDNYGNVFNSYSDIDMEIDINNKVGLNIGGISGGNYNFDQIYNVYYTGNITPLEIGFGIVEQPGSMERPISNAYYIDTYSSGGTLNTTAVSDTDLRAATFVTTLNNNLATDGYNWATWQQSSTYPTLTGNEPIFIINPLKNNPKTFSVYLLGEFTDIVNIKLYSLDGELLKTYETSEIFYNIPEKEISGLIGEGDGFYCELENKDGETLKSNKVYRRMDM